MICACQKTALNSCVIHLYIISETKRKKLPQTYTIGRENYTESLPASTVLSLKRLVTRIVYIIDPRANVFSIHNAIKEIKNSLQTIAKQLM